MITEDYVSFEMAKLLKEKGFDMKKAMNKQNMECPIDKAILPQGYQLYYGREMYDSSHHAGETKWIFPDGVREKIEDDKLYCVWEKCYEASDPYDTSEYHKVIYIEDFKGKE